MNYLFKFLRAGCVSLTFTLLFIILFQFEPIKDIFSILSLIFMSLFGSFCLGIMDELTHPLKRKKFEEYLKDAQDITQEYIENYGFSFVNIDDLDLMIAKKLAE